MKAPQPKEMQLCFLPQGDRRWRAAEPTTVNDEGLSRELGRWQCRRRKDHVRESTGTGASVYVGAWLDRVLLSARFGSVFVLCRASLDAFSFFPLWPFFFLSEQLRVKSRFSPYKRSPALFGREATPRTGQLPHSKPSQIQLPLEPLSINNSHCLPLSSSSPLYLRPNYLTKIKVFLRSKRDATWTTRKPPRRHSKPLKRPHNAKNRVGRALISGAVFSPANPNPGSNASISSE